MKQTIYLVNAYFYTSFGKRHKKQIYTQENTTFVWIILCILYHSIHIRKDDNISSKHAMVVVLTRNQNTIHLLKRNSYTQWFLYFYGLSMYDAAFWKTCTYAYIKTNGCFQLLFKLHTIFINKMKACVLVSAAQCIPVVIFLHLTISVYVISMFWHAFL